MKIIARVPTGSALESTGYKTILHSIQGITCAGFVVVGLERKKSRLTISNLVQTVTCLTLIIFSLRMGSVTTAKEVNVGNHK